ncbi:hypothetical protein [Legionella pneumophila]|uniref:hypothetical protein n=1 Tax=Legionella pneumophila TaxID=446 RepID=UPI000776E981|nr:hypothetical protein [Legionella pneumophila]MDW8872783.1 hypothetical protein [Legionella pneumophila]HAT8656818.1 hypothetical protein [Legionella pneumophila]
MNFHSKKLQTLFDNSKHFLDNLSSLKEYIIEDINSLESYLKTIKLDKSVSHTINGGNGFTPTTELTSEKPVYGFTNREVLFWCPEAKCIMYEERQYTTIYDYSKEHPSERLVVQNDNFKKIVSTPLSEANFEIKRFVYLNNYLEGFIQSILEIYTES